jgi:hypothetical protein
VWTCKLLFYPCTDLYNLSLFLGMIFLLASVCMLGDGSARCVAYQRCSLRPVFFKGMIRSPAVIVSWSMIS